MERKTQSWLKMSQTYCFIDFKLLWILSKYYLIIIIVKRTLRSKQAVKTQYFVDTELNVLEIRSLGNSQTTLLNCSTSLD